MIRCVCVVAETALVHVYMFAYLPGSIKSVWCYVAICEACSLTLVVLIFLVLLTGVVNSV